MTTVSVTPERQLPADIDAERASLGALLIDRDAIVIVASWLFPEYFYLEKHAWVYEAILECYNRRVPPDVRTVSDRLRSTNRLDAVGGVPYLVELSVATPTAVHIEYYARVVERTALLRRLIQAGGQIAALGFNEAEELETTLDKAEATLQRVVDQRADQEFTSLAELSDRFFEGYCAQAEQPNPDGVTGLRTHFRDLDELLGGLQKSDLIILAARPSVGKTAGALQIAYNAALYERATIGIFSLEMSKEQLHQRILAQHTGLNSQKLRSGLLRDSDADIMTRGLGAVSDLKIYIDDTPGLTINEVRAKSRRLKLEKGVDLLIVDYLQLMQGRARDRVQEIGDISRGLKAIARELDVPVIALSQLSRAVETRASHVPMLSDLRESGTIEQEADIVIFLYREEIYDPNTDKAGVTELHIAKHRNGPVGVVPLRFDKSINRFVDLDRYRQPVGY